MKIEKSTTGWFAKTCVSVFVLFAAGQGFATCVQGDMTGTWYLNGMSGNAFYGELWETDFCKVNVNSNGKVIATGSKCGFRDWNGKGTLNIKGGLLEVDASCSVTGRVKVCDGDLCANWVADDARMDKSQRMMTFVARRSDDADIIGFFTAVKQ